MQGMNFWTVKERDWTIIKDLAQELGVSSLAAQLLVNRGITNVEDARIFFDASLSSLAALDVIPGYREAGVLIRQAILGEEKMIVFGDYDADGVTATALLVKGLRKAGGRVDYYIPDRFSEGYDLNEAFIAMASSNAYSLVITVDCGIKAFSCVNLAKEKGLKIIVTDHHQPGDSVPQADVVINPKLHEASFTMELAGVGVALGLVRAVLTEMVFEPSEAASREMLELAALGTIADSVSLIGCNRVIVRHGLKSLGETSNIGLAALLEVQGLKDKEDFEVTDISFRLAPCINAVGRLGNAGEAVSLLLSDSPQEVWELAKKFHRDNSLRQNLDGTIFLEAIERIEQEVDLSTEKVIVLASENWHPGVIGITAARIVQRFNKPAVLIALDGEVGKGSGRSLGSFNLNDAFGFSSDLLLKYGGHKLAGGLSISAEKVADFRRRINEYAGECSEVQLSLGEVDGEVILQDIDLGILEEIEVFKPFGPCNPVPLFICNNVRIDSTRFVGKKNDHLKVVVSADTEEIDCIGFKMAEKAGSLKQGDFADIVFSPELNTWNGNQKLQLLLSDIKQRVKVCKKDFGNPEDLEACATGEATIGWSELVEYIKKGQQVQYLSNNGEEKLLFALPWLKETGTACVALFPLQSLAADFEKLVKETCQHLRVASIDCTTPGEQLQETAKLIADGNLDLLVTSLGTFQANEALFRAFDSRESCMFIHMGHWGTMFPSTNYLEEVRTVLSRWSQAALVLGSGKYLGCDEVVSGLGVSEAGGENGLFDQAFYFHPAGNKLEALCDICSRAEKNLVLVNTGREAVQLSRELVDSVCISSRNIRSYYGGFLHTQKKLILEDFNYGTTGVLVASRNLEPYTVKHANALVVHTFPLNAFDYNRFLVAPQVHFTFNVADVEKSAAYMHTLCPDDEMLQAAAKNLKWAGNSSLAEVARKMAKGLQGNSSFSRRALAVALSVISETGSEDLKNGDVKSSWRYLEAKREIDAFQLAVEALCPNQAEAAAALEGL